MTTKEIAQRMAERYAKHDTTAFSDWMDISEYEKGDLGIHYCMEHEEEHLALDENMHLFKRALRALTHNDDREAARLIRAVFAGYTPVEKLWEQERESFLLDHSFVDGPSYDEILDSQRG